MACLLELSWPIRGRRTGAEVPFRGVLLRCCMEVDPSNPPHSLFPRASIFPQGVHEAPHLRAAEYAVGLEVRLGSAPLALPGSDSARPTQSLQRRARAGLGTPGPDLLFPIS